MKHKFACVIQNFFCLRFSATTNGRSNYQSSKKPNRFHFQFPINDRTHNNYSWSTLKLSSVVWIETSATSFFLLPCADPSKSLNNFEVWYNFFPFPFWTRSLERDYFLKLPKFGEIILIRYLLISRGKIQMRINILICDWSLKFLFRQYYLKFNSIIFYLSHGCHCDFFLS